MAHHLPPLNWLRTFEASARHLSFTHAANELGLSQVAVSKQVKQLELHLREPLFVRRARSLEMTKVAEAYLPKVRDSFERLSDGTKEVFGGRRSKTLTLRAAVGFSVNWLAPRLPDFHARYPGISLRIVSSVWNEEIGNPEFDLDIRYGTGKWPDTRADRLTWDTITPVCDPSLVRSGDLNRYEDLTSCTLIHVLGYEEGWAKWLRAAGMADVIDADKGLQVDNSLMAFELAECGCGLALARSCLADRVIASGSLVKPFDLGVPIDEAFYLISPATVQDHADSEAFRAWLLEMAQLGRQRDL